MYHTRTGCSPHVTIQELLTSASITQPRQFNPAIPPELDNLIMEVLVDEPAPRLADADELQRRLQAMLARERWQTLPPPQPLPPGTGYLDQAATLLAQGRIEEARNAAAEATLHSTGLIPALELYATLSDRLGYTEDAISAFKRILALESASSETRRSVETQIANPYLRLHRTSNNWRYCANLPCEHSLNQRRCI
jgi:tetratricopeptide (TPR) repeat protein